MTRPDSLASIGRAWTEMLDGLADELVAGLMRTHRLMSDPHPLDDAARLAIEGATSWRKREARR